MGSVETLATVVVSSVLSFLFGAKVSAEHENMPRAYDKYLRAYVKKIQEKIKETDAENHISRYYIMEESINEVLEIEKNYDALTGVKEFRSRFSWLYHEFPWLKTNP